MGNIKAGTIYEDDSAILVGQVIKSTTGSLLVQADFGTITYGIWTSSGTEVVAAGTSLTVANVILETAFTNEKLWGLDTTGGNFRLIIAADVLTSPDTEYHVEVEFVESGGAQTTGVWKIITLPRNTS